MIMSIRNQIIEAFEPLTGNYSHVLPHVYSNFIDGMAWVSLLAGSAKLINDTEVVKLCESYLSVLCSIKDSRNYAPYVVADNWIYDHKSMYWIKSKPQAFAGSCLLHWAKEQGVNVDTSNIEKPILLAKFLVYIAPVFGHLIRYIPVLRQHINSVLMAHLLLDTVPPESMKFLTEDNMIYSYLYKEPCHILYPNTGAFPAKDYPDTEKEISIKIYTPLCNYVGICLQSLLDKGD